MVAEPIVRTVFQRGLHHDELEIGVRYAHAPGRTVAESDDILFSTLTMNSASLHLDAEISSRQEFGQRLVNSTFTLSTLVGLSVGHLTQGIWVANLGREKVEFPRPVFVEETLSASTVVLTKRLSRSRPTSGVVTFEHSAHNQRHELVAVARRTALMLRDPEGAGG